MEWFSGHRSPFDYRLDYRFLVGSIFGILRTVPNRFLSGLGTLYVELFRNVPLIVQFFTWYLVVPELLPEDLGMWFKAELDPNIQFSSPQ
ncbi:glutamate/aspartate transporter permease GltJ [Salmonella enterica subsp. enterica]|nr:glutamate/aspartate transporter permease GltJ [Salmonella enterica subsp. enterica] [Salmonella enterica subsp. enterica serovar Menston]